MDTVTYPHPATIQLIHDHLIAVKVQVTWEPSLANRFNVQYTPTIVTLDEEGREHHRTVGFLGVEDFIPSMMLGIGTSHYENGRFKKAKQILDRLVADYPESRWARDAANLKRAADKQTH